MMKIKKKTQYAIRVLLCLSRYHSYVKLDTICQSTAVPCNQLKRILSELQNADLLKSRNGCKGGYRLNKSPLLISLYDVMEAVEGPLNDDVQGASRGDTGEKTAEVALETILQQRVTSALKCVALGDYVDFPQPSVSVVTRPWLHGLPSSVHINPIGYDTCAAPQLR